VKIEGAVAKEVDTAVPLRLLSGQKRGEADLRNTNQDKVQEAVPMLC
jgi:hypothetical protein